MQRTMLAAVHATDKRLIAPQNLMQISAHPAFSCTKHVLLLLALLLAFYTSRYISSKISFALSFFAHQKNK